MNLEKHLIGSVVTGCLVAALCTSSIWTLQTYSYLYVLAVTMFFGLLPELSKTSAPQQWFYRVIFAVLVYYAYQGELKLGIVLAIISIIPLLSQGYNWMHNLWSAILVPMSLVLLYSIFLTQGVDTWKVLNLQLIEQKIKLNLWFILAGTMGWLTNILIDRTFTASSR